jgi:glucosamine 6-phosphate synthetase-like amidotransferase/phosphosugar isomerase protein
MCGLFGFIGDSSNPDLTRDLSTHLFVKTQIRGTDASGFYCAEDFKNKNINYFKKPIQANEFVNLPEYKNLWENNLNLGLFHCRAASSGVGLPAYNQNNHPFVSKDLKKAVIHNGVIPRDEYDFFKQYYEVETECDSEIFLRILEQKNDFTNNARNFFNFSKNAHYAVVFGEAEDTNRTLHLFRNEHRPLVIVDLIDELNQIFFCSTMPIFFEALELLNRKIKKYKLYELPADNYMVINYNDKQKFDVEEFKIKSKEDFTVKNNLTFHSIDSKDSDWKNKIPSNDEGLHQVIGRHLDGILGNCHYLNMQLNDGKSYNQSKYSVIFNILKDVSKKMDFLIKHLDE